MMNPVAENLHKRSIVIDGCCPLASVGQYWKNYKDGGTTAVAATLNMPHELTRDTIRRTASWLKTIEQYEDSLILVSCVDDIYRAKKEDKLGIILHLQGSHPFENDINNAVLFHKLGVRIVQLCYNTMDFVGSGCSERVDSGLSHFGYKLIVELNRLGIVIDCAHTGIKTTIEAMEASETPVIISHANSRSVCNNKRNLPDEIAHAIADNGGIVGITGYPDFVKERGENVSLDDFVQHVKYMTDLIGEDKVSIGMDYFRLQAGVASDKDAKTFYEEKINSGTWSTSEYSPPPFKFPSGLEMPEKMGNLTEALIESGYSNRAVQKIMGQNLVRIYKEVWK